MQGQAAAIACAVTLLARTPTTRTRTTTPSTQRRCKSRASTLSPPTHDCLPHLQRPLPCSPGLLPATPTPPPPLLPRSLACHTYTAPSLAPQVSLALSLRGLRSLLLSCTSTLSPPTQACRVCDSVLYILQHRNDVAHAAAPPRRRRLPTSEFAFAHHAATNLRQHVDDNGTHTYLHTDVC